mmetsp:Transcript_95664/g.309936  ORF Transcript_95664/g.309936 Transcript_95664/m.309936 type:complete len:155 (+) Transcript_95664:824-1288(+)
MSLPPTLPPPPPPPKRPPQDAEVDGCSVPVAGCVGGVLKGPSALTGPSAAPKKLGKPCGPSKNWSIGDMQQPGSKKLSIGDLQQPGSKKLSIGDLQPPIERMERVGDGLGPLVSCPPAPEFADAAGGKRRPPAIALIGAPICHKGCASLKLQAT